MLSFFYNLKELKCIGISTDKNAYELKDEEEESVKDFIQNTFNESRIESEASICQETAQPRSLCGVVQLFGAMWQRQRRFLRAEASVGTSVALL